MAAAVSTSMAHMPPLPSGIPTRLGSPSSFTPKASPRECAGSVDTTSTRRPSRASRTASEALMVVLPTPPLPPKNMTLRSGTRFRRLDPYTDEDKCSSAGRPTKASGRSSTSKNAKLRRLQIFRISSTVLRCAATREFQYESPRSALMIWLAMSLPQKIPSRRKSTTRRAASAVSNAVGRVTTTNSAQVPSAEPGCRLRAPASHATRSRTRRILVSASDSMASTSPVCPPRPTMLSMPPTLLRMLSTRSMKSPRNWGTSSILNVWPVGAVSNTTMSKPAASEAALAIAAISSTPGGGDSKTSESSPNPSAAVVPPGKPSPSKKPRASTARNPARSSPSASFASTSAAHKFSATSRGLLDNCSQRASPKEWAGSVDKMSVRCPRSAQASANAADAEVLPTPPLPPKKMSRRGTSVPEGAVDEVS
mmetsp:Transcript_15763/g.44894  ORF Transcript_15763/g.44894 Transcript_15763/m.44894 type:complete len:423 (+) Transcript_15763:890-2158(+)